MSQWELWNRFFPDRSSEFRNCKRAFPPIMEAGRRVGGRLPSSYLREPPVHFRACCKGVRGSTTPSTPQVGPPESVQQPPSGRLPFQRPHCQSPASGTETPTPARLLPRSSRFERFENKVEPNFSLRLFSLGGSPPNPKKKLV